MLFLSVFGLDEGYLHETSRQPTVAYFAQRKATKGDKGTIIHFQGVRVTLSTFTEVDLISAEPFQNALEYDYSHFVRQVFSW